MEHVLFDSLVPHLSNERRGRAWAWVTQTSRVITHHFYEDSTTLPGNALFFFQVNGEIWHLF